MSRFGIRADGKNCSCPALCEARSPSQISTRGTSLIAERNPSCLHTSLLSKTLRTGKAQKASSASNTGSSQFGSSPTYWRSELRSLRRRFWRFLNSLPNIDGPVHANPPGVLFLRDSALYRLRRFKAPNGFYVIHANPRSLKSQRRPGCRTRCGA